MGLPADYDENTITSDEAMESIFQEQDTIIRARLILQFEARAKELDSKLFKREKDKTIWANFKRVLRAWQQTFNEAQKARRQHPENNHTEFGYFEDGHELFCGGWIANYSGIKMFSDKGDLQACYHPIMPIERLKNMETGEELIKLAYFRNNKWADVKVGKDVIATASKITNLSKFGIAVTSENAKALVRYLSDIENWNEALIPVQKSTAKLGWHGEDFIPYDEDIIFDGDNRFKGLFDAVHERGSFDTWMDHVKELRKTNRIEIKFMLAASFASILIKDLGDLPFFVDLWGETEGGKTVTLMLATSVWANPGESQYIGDFKTTDVALEAKADMLNNLPMILDDTSKTSARIRENFEGVIYDLCSGKGKSRSNKELGINRENRWKLCILCNGERPLNSYANQGGAINRIIEVECGNHIYQDPQRTADILKRNYGFAGKMFVELVKAIDKQTLQAIYQGFLHQLMSTDKMQKQAISVATILTADKIATDYIFKDGIYITVDEAKTTLVDRAEVSDNQRCYEYLIDKIAMNRQRFDTDTRVEKWGTIEDGYAVIYSQAFRELCQQGGFSDKSFLKWADFEGLIQVANGRNTKLKRVDGKVARCIVLKLLDENMKNFDEVIEKDDFVSLDEYSQAELPFY